MTREIPTTRIAVVKATGDMYVIQQINISAGKVHCWGEVTSYKTGRGYTREEQLSTGASMTHAGSKAFVRDAVDVVEMRHDGHLANKLLAQGNRNMGGIIKSRQIRR